MKVFILGVDSGKEIVVSRLSTVDEGPGYCHFPINADRGYSETVIKGLNSEQRVTEVKDGFCNLVNIFPPSYNSTPRLTVPVRRFFFAFPGVFFM